MADPLTAFANSVAKGAAWCVEQLAKTVDSTSSVDFTNLAFLQQYAVVFAASTVLTIILWLVAVAKRAMRGVPLTTALGEAIGFLWLTVIASAFTPLILHVVVSAVDGVTKAATGGNGSAAQLFTTMANALRNGGENIGGGPIILLAASALTILLAGLLWLELVLRSSALYLGAVLGAVVYSGLVDRELWGKVRTYAGIMIALILIKPIITIALGIASVFTAAQGPGSTSVIAAGIIVILLALAAGVAIFRFVPGYGDDIAAGLALRTTVKAGRTGLKMGTSAAGVVAQGIHTHAGRGGTQGGSNSSSGQGGGSKNRANGVADGISTHGTRGSARPKKSGKD
ncbi:hypothetical protein [Streptomyces sp. NPDC054863]